MVSKKAHEADGGKVGVTLISFVFYSIMLSGGISTGGEGKESHSKKKTKAFGIIFKKFLPSKRQ